MASRIITRMFQSVLAIINFKKKEIIVRNVGKSSRDTLETPTARASHRASESKIRPHIVSKQLFWSRAVSEQPQTKYRIGPDWPPKPNAKANLVSQLYLQQARPLPLPPSGPPRAQPAVSALHSRHEGLTAAFTGLTPAHKQSHEAPTLK